MLLLGYAGAFRRGELAAVSMDDVQITPTRLTLTARRSKTDQDGEGMIKVIPAMQYAAVCPVRALSSWLAAARLEDGPLFRGIDCGGNVSARAMNSRQVARIVKHAAARSGLNARHYAGHSLRAGFVTEAAGAGAEAWQIIEQTGHRSHASLRRYIRSAGRGAMQATHMAFRNAC